MLGHRAARSARSVTSLLRPFSSSAVAYRAPSIRDLTAESSEEFLRRQKEFRENLEQARLRREQQESQSVNASASASTPSREYAPTAPQVSNASQNRIRPAFDAAAALDYKAMGSLSMHRYIGDEEQQEATAKRGPLSSLIYGTKEGQHFDKDMERSFSEVLARGKYVHSIVMHDVKPDKVDEYVELVGQWYPRMAATEENRVNLVGSWRTQVGDNDTFGKSRLRNPNPCSYADPGIYLNSSHLGISTLRRLPCLPSQHFGTPRVP